jgi:hypothetical protein
MLNAGAIDQETHARAVEEANNRQLRSSQAWTDGAARFLQDYVAESQDAAMATERAFATAFGGAEDALVGFTTRGKLDFRGLADTIVADISRMAVRQTITAPLAGVLQGAFTGAEFGIFHDGGVVGGMPTSTRHADPAIFDQAPRCHTGGFAGGGLLPDQVPIIARRGELVVPPERIVRGGQAVGDQRPITVMINVTAADANSFRASQAQIAGEAARVIERAGRNWGFRRPPEWPLSVLGFVAALTLRFDDASPFLPESTASLLNFQPLIAPAVRPWTR